MRKCFLFYNLINKKIIILKVNKIQKRFLRQILLFFAPVVVAYLVIDFAVLQIPQSYQNKAAYLNTHGQSIQAAGFGSSQMQNAINPEFLDVEAINFGSTSQHHKLDFEILKQIKKSLDPGQVLFAPEAWSIFQDY